MKYLTSNTKDKDPDIIELDDERWAFTVGGIVRFVGSWEDCHNRHSIFALRPAPREYSDAALIKALQR